MLLSDELNITKLLKEEGQDILRFSNMVAAQVTTKYGAIESIPTIEDVTTELNNDRKLPANDFSNSFTGFFMPDILNYFCFSDEVIIK